MSVGADRVRRGSPTTNDDVWDLVRDFWCSCFLPPSLVACSEGGLRGELRAWRLMTIDSDLLTRSWPVDAEDAPARCHQGDVQLPLLASPICVQPGLMGIAARETTIVWLIS